MRISHLPSEIFLSLLVTGSCFAPGCTPLTSIYFKNAEDQYAVGNFEGAIREYDKALRFDSTNARAYSNRGLMFHEMGYLNEAIRDQTEALRLSPKLADAFAYRGAARFDLYWRLRDERSDSLTGTVQVMLDLSIAATKVLMLNDFTEAIRLRPEDDWAYNSRGRAHFEVGNYADAIQDFSRAIFLNPWGTWAYYNRGLAELEMQEYSRSIEDFTKSLESDREDGWAYFKRGEARLHSGDAENGCDDLHRAMSLGVTEAADMIDSECP